MRTPEIDRVRAAHDRMIGIDPSRDARVITFVSRPQPRACHLTDRPRQHSMFDRCTTDDHALDREQVTERAGDKCLSRPGAEPASRPKPAAPPKASLPQKSLLPKRQAVAQLVRLFSPPRECRGQQRGHQRGQQSSRLLAPVTTSPATIA